MIQATPAIVTQAGARRLPRWALLFLCTLYLLPGYVGREPWKSADVTSYGIMSWMAAGHLDWWNPQIPGQEEASPALLPHWLGAALVSMWPEHAEWMYRVPSLLAAAATLFFTWHAVFRFSLFPSALPVTFAFGGQAEPVDYARAVADSGLLALLASLGLAQLIHEAAPDVFLTASAASVLYASSRLAQANRDRRKRVYACWVGGFIGMGLSGMPLLALALFLMTAGWLVLEHSRQTSNRGEIGSTHGIAALPWLALALGLAAMSVVLIWTTPWRLETIGSAAGTFNAASFLKLLTWFTWPLWPLTLWTVWRWRSHLIQPHLALPLMFTSAIVVTSILLNGSDRTLMLALPPLAVLAAFALPTLTRSISALIDWFSVLFFSFCSLTVWVIWLAMLTGYPAKPAANVARLAPGFSLEFDVIAFSFAAIASFGWLAIARWRITRHPPAMWKSMVLPATGVSLCWLLLMTLWLPLLDHARSYGPVARQIAARIPSTECAAAEGLNTAQIAGLFHQGPIRIDLGPSESSECPYLITALGGASPEWQQQPTEWHLLGRFNRLSDRKEGLLLFSRLPAPVNNTTPDAIEQVN